MNRSQNYIDILLKFIFPIYLMFITLLTFHRLVLVTNLYSDIFTLYPSTEDSFIIILRALLRGFRFDNIVMSTTLTIPIFVLIFLWITNGSTKLYLKISTIFFIISSIVILTFSSIDTPYYQYFAIHPNKSIFNWLGHGNTYSMILQESSYYIYFIFYIISLIVAILVILFLYRQIRNRKEESNTFFKKISFQFLIFILSVLFLFGGYRGFAKDPINIVNSRFTMFGFINDIAVTPIYNFYISLITKAPSLKQLTESEEALEYVKSCLDIKPNHQNKNPLTRYIEVDSLKESTKQNIVLIFMESMSSDALGKEENNQKLTPFLDSLIDNSLYFENFYSSGTHTNCGVMATLTGYPSIFEKHMMVPPFFHKSMATTLNDLGYKSLFAIPHDEEYDNMGNFLRASDFDYIFDIKNNRDQVTGFWGIPDDVLLKHSISEIAKISDNPFLAVIMTISNHPPLVIPRNYRDVSDKDELAILRYIDDSLKEFMHNASKQKWYNNTIFILVGDHGKLTNNSRYNMSLSYNHVPCIIYSPSFTNMPQRLSQFGGQIDIYPTVMGLLNQPYFNNTLGIDLFKDTRPYMFFTSDTHMGCINDSLFFVLDPLDDSEYLYNLKNGENVINKLPNKVKEMKEYGTSMLTVSKDLYMQGLTDQY